MLVLGFVAVRWYLTPAAPAQVRQGQAGRVVAALGGKAFEVGDGDRAAYHAAACIASNHLVALLAQVQRVGALAGVPLDAYLDLVRTTVDNVARLGPEAALTGPVARGDWETVAHHLAALPEDERPGYEALADLAARLAAGRGRLADVGARSAEVGARGAREAAVGAPEARP